MVIYNNYNKCEFCNGNHNCRVCPIEKVLCEVIKTKIGVYMEEFVENNIVCSECNLYSLKRFGDNRPSLDLECYICNKMIEVKSKCLSINTLPDDIQCKGGNHKQFKFNIDNNNLDLILIIYGVDRKKKTIIIREIYNIDNHILHQPDIIEITQNPESTNSLITIKDRRSLTKIKYNEPSIISFKPWIKKLINNINN